MSDLSVDASVPLSDYARKAEAAEESEGVPRTLAAPEKSAPLPGLAGSSSAAVSQAFEIGEEDKQTKLGEWARWQGRRQQRLERRSVLREKYRSVNAECRLGFCSSDCSQCKVIASKPLLDTMP